MSESIFASIIDEMAERELARYSEIPPFETSKKHDRAMRRIFKRYERNTRRLRPQSEMRIITIRRRLTVALLVIILAVITGFTTAYFISRGFRGEAHSNNTELFPIDVENCPTIIEAEYYLSEIPEGFEKASTCSNPFSMTVMYENNLTGQIITFEQWVKSEFDSIHFNTEKGEAAELEINGHYGVCIEINDDPTFTDIIWDNEDYILHISGSLSKKELGVLAKSAKV